jgi:hypothetical protein
VSGAKENSKLNSSKGVISTLRDDSMEGAVGRLYKIELDVHRLQSARIDLVYATSCIHKNSAYVVSSDLSHENHGRMSWSRYFWRVVFSAKLDWMIKLVEELYCWRRRSDC